MKHPLSLLLLLFLLGLSTQAQKELKPLRAYVKAGKSSEAIKEAERLLNDSAWKDNADIYDFMFQAHQQMYDRQNEKMYLGQKADTTAYFAAVRGMFFSIYNCDKAEQKHFVATGKKIRYRAPHIAAMKGRVGNLLAGATYCYQHSMFAEAEEAAYLFLRTTTDEAFWGNALPRSTEKERQIASLIHVQGNYHGQHYDRMYTYAKDALKYEPARAEVMEELAVGRLMLGDSVAYRDSLLHAIREFPERQSLFTRLDSYMREHGEYVSLLNLTREVQQNDSIRLDLLRSEAYALNALGRTEELQSVAEAIVKLEPNDAYANLYLGIMYVQLAEQVSVPLRRTDPNYKARSEERQHWYSKAKEPMERYRKAQPNDIKTWAPRLHDIYLYLNMGNEYEEICRIKW